jgi:hypothetical protein
MQYNKPYSFEKTDVRGLFYFNFFKRNVETKNVCPIAYNGLGLGEGGLVGCSKFAECVCPLLPNPCYRQ